MARGRAARQKDRGEKGGNERKMRKKRAWQERNGKKREEGRHIERDGAQILARAARLRLAYIPLRLPSSHHAASAFPLQYEPRGSSASIVYFGLLFVTAPLCPIVYDREIVSRED